MKSDSPIVNSVIALNRHHRSNGGVGTMYNKFVEFKAKKLYTYCI
jgi:hypothetical protein